MHFLLSQFWFGPTLITPISSLDPPLEGTLKINIDGSFLEDFGCLCARGVVRNHDGDWIAGFSHYGAGADALLVELRAIQIGFDFCNLKGYVNIICESDRLEAVDLIIDGSDHTLHTYATDILHIRDALHGNGNTTLEHVFREQNIGVDFMAKEASHARCSTRWNCPPRSMESLILRNKLGT